MRSKTAATQRKSAASLLWRIPAHFRFYFERTCFPLFSFSFLEVDEISLGKSHPSLFVFFSPPHSWYLVFFLGGGAGVLWHFYFPLRAVSRKHGGVRNNNNNTNKWAVSSSDRSSTASVCNGLCMYLNVRFRGLLFCLFFCSNLQFRSHRCPLWIV